MGGMDYVEHTICECRERECYKEGRERDTSSGFNVCQSVYFIRSTRSARRRVRSPHFSYFASLFFTLPRGNNLKENYSCNLCVCVVEARNV